jgi:uncharacterized protein YndB with AHSA1/START domain
MTRDPDHFGTGAAEISLARRFDGPRDLLFRLWTEPRYVASWWGIEGATVPVCEIDLRPAGLWRLHMRTADGTVYPNTYEFLEVVPNERLLFRDVRAPVADGEPRQEPAVHTVTFHDDGDGTLVTLNTRFASVEDCERAVRYGMQQGIEQSLDRLERLVARTA